ERIFGPVKDWECSCGKYKRIKHRGVVCDRCGVEVTLARVRRERMGHIELAVPVSHIWFFKCMPSRIGLMLDMTARNLERVIYYEDYMVIDPGNTPLKELQLLSEHEYREARQTYGSDAFVAKMGAEAVRDALARIELDSTVEVLQQQMLETKSKQNRKKIAKRIKLFQGFSKSKTRPEWMILTVLPVIPPDLRPLVPLEGGRFATSDLNDLYRRVINRNNRLKNLLQLKTPEVIIRNEKRMLQEAVDALFDNGRHGRAVTGAGNRALKSLSDMLKGKSGRFRQNLLGKRVDYSGRSVIVIGPELKLNQCGLPKKMALVLFEPFIIRKLKERGYVHTVRSAKKMIERQSPEVWDILEEVTRGHAVLLNRAPTLHRLSIQAFEPTLIEGEAIRIHPLVCTAYNADFDGDQMAVHVPLSVEAQMEARLLMMAPLNIFSPSSGKPIMTPTQDITLGCYYLTAEPRKSRKETDRLMLFGDKAEAIFAHTDGALRIHDRIRLKNPDYGHRTTYGNSELKTIETTVGRVIFSEIWPRELGFANFPVGKSKIGDLIFNCYKVCGHEQTVVTLDRLKEIGFSEATRAGVSIGIDDMIIPEAKSKEIEAAHRQITDVEKQHKKGVITNQERYNKVIDIWTHCTDQIANVMLKTLQENQGKKEFNPVYLMVDSGARGNKAQVRQLAGLRGLMAKPSGEIIEKPILSNFREGLTVVEYFMSTHGARKGLADTALKTADSGYMTRKLVDVAQDVIIRMTDCGTTNGIWVSEIREGEEVVVKLSERLVGRHAAEDIIDPTSPKTKLAKANEEIDELKAKAIEAANVERVKIRSVLTCEAKVGCCMLCYGRHLGTGLTVKMGEAVGIIAAQSIGEPGTQLTMRTFHLGGTASQVFKQPQIKTKVDATVRFNELRIVELEDGNCIVLNKNGSLTLLADDGRELETHTIVIGSVISVRNGGKVKKGDTFVQWDPYNVPILSEKAGTIVFNDIIEGVTMK
ncbi:MAG: DNA-directed RNA polymerase subunit beta', partial [Verrucomicrobiota bacterium]